MLEERNLKLDLLALGVLALTIFLAASLFSYSSADPPGCLIYPPASEIKNACGRSGAIVSAFLFNAFGLGAYYLLLSMAVLDSLLLARREINEPVLRTIGWLLTLVGFTTLVAMITPGLSPGPVIGSGGYFGAAGRGILEANFASVGAYILTLAVIVGGLLLCTDYFVIRLFAWTLGFPAKRFSYGVARMGAACVEKAKTVRAAVDDCEEGIKPSVRIASRDSVDNDEEEIEEDYYEEETDEEESRAQQLRIKKPKKSRREEMIENLDETAVDEDQANYELPPLDLLLESDNFCFDEHEKDVRHKAKILEHTFANFGFNIRVVEIQTGPVIAQFEVELEAGLRLAKVTGLADDLAIALRVPSVRIVAPIPGKNTVGVEVPNNTRQLVRLREVMEEANGKSHKMRIPVFLGKDVAGNPMVADLASLPHLLIAGRTGTGKSVCLNSIILSMLMTRRPDEVKMLMIDPKMVELSPYKRLPHLMHPVVTDMRKAEAILGWAVEKMEERYQLLARAGVRHISSYNQLGKEELMERMEPADEADQTSIPTHMPYIVMVADEMADLMLTAAKEVEGHIIRLAQKSRAVGIHLVLATQKPTVDVITGLIKSNLPARISFQVASRTDSRVVLDEMGADKLLGNGDMLFLWPGTSTLIRGQGTFLCDDEINRVISAVATTEPQFVKELVQLKATKQGADGKSFEDRDVLYEGAVDVIVREGRGSVSLLQRALGIGYGRAARLIDYMEEDGFVGPYNGSQAREILITLEDWEAMCGGEEGTQQEVPKPTPKRRNNKILIEQEEEEVEDEQPEEYEDAECEEDVEDEYVYEDEEENGEEPEDQYDYEEDAIDAEFADDAQEEDLDGGEWKAESA